MKIALIGMSGSGKTFWSKQLTTRGFVSYGCDEMIGEALTHDFQQQGFIGTKMVAEWMGQPYDTRYATNSALYLNKEASVIRSILKKIRQLSPNKNIVVDTTGSLIYLSPNIIHALRQHVKFVYLRSSASRIKQMIKLYFDDPKPVIWGNKYTKIASETELESIHRCYPLLLKYRSGLYRKLADWTINTDKLWDPDFTIESLIQVISQ